LAGAQVHATFTTKYALIIHNSFIVYTVIVYHACAIPSRQEFALTDEQMYKITGHFFQDFGDQPLPTEVTECARAIALDTMAVMVRGYREADVLSLARRYTEDAKGASLFSQPSRKIDPLRAIVCNTASAAAMELCEGNRFSGGHIALQVLPALLAAAEKYRVPGERFLPALVMGYEIAARMGRAAERHVRTHGHGMWAAAGSSVAIAWMMGRSAAQILECLKIASNLSLAPAFATHAEGATVRNVTAGMGGMMGYWVPDLQEAGYLGSNSAMAITLGETLGASFSRERFTENLGSEYQVTSNYYKFEASGRHMHAATEALRGILCARDIRHAEVDRIDVETYFPASSLVNTAPANALAAKTSIPYSIAALLVLGDLGHNAYDAEHLGDQRVRDLMRRVNVIESEQFTDFASPSVADRLPVRSARVSVTLRSGETLSEVCENPRGDFDFPATPAALHEKYRQLTEPMLGARKSQRLHTLVSELESVPDLGAAFQAVLQGE
jgi:2-methylcitrate dehydratase PrpD